MTDQHLEDLIVHIVTPLVDHPDDIRVIREESDQKIALRLSVHKSDTGKVIGKQGRTAKAIRTAVFAAGAQSSKKVQFEIFD
ncbi:KH domain-containing protein [Bacillus subtilis]|uniref:KH domain-containing protein n=1 Tax=Bacillus subtilis TaxID=1423 RepID=UPI00132C4F3A|nr:KH domain-containing protein [Bacillus subtilis]MDO3652792.1 KH domain-containing protein [Bacillus subtilis]MUG00267.1 KH domain-containing protein [Bacillus tequilensis]